MIPINTDITAPILYKGVIFVVARMGGATLDHVIVYATESPEWQWKPMTVPKAIPKGTLLAVHQIENNLKLQVGDPSNNSVRDFTFDLDYLIIQYKALLEAGS